MPISATPHVGRMASRAWRAPFRTIALRTIVTVVMLAGTAAEAQAPRPPIDSEHTPSGIGMQAGSALATIAYFPFKAVTAIGGGIVGGLGYLFSGGSKAAANAVWVPSVYGTYIITPDHLAGRKPVQFFGKTQSQPATQSPRPAR
jgi:hypothetical protein